MVPEMTSKERVRAALAHQETDRVPLSMGFGLNPPVVRQLEKYLNLKPGGGYGWVNKFTDLRWIAPDWIGPEERGSWADYTAKRKVNYLGIVQEAKSYGKGENQGFYDEYVEFPLKDAEKIEDLDNYWWPSADWFDYSKIPEKIKKANINGEKAMLLHPIATIYENAWQMTGIQKMYMNLIEEPEFASALIGHIADFYIAMYRKALEAADGMIDIVFCGDDLGTQISLQMSRDTYREVVQPHHKRLFDVIHEYDAKVLYHCDGAIMPIVPDLIDSGVDVLEALQFDAEGMDPVLLKENFGDRLCFHGGVSVQKTIPFGTAEEVRDETIERIEVLSRGGGYICAPSHAIQAGSPPENAVAFFETAYNYRKANQR